jgi:hypothetical protein
MKIGERDILIKGKKIKAKITIKEVGDRELLKNLYSDWKKLNDIYLNPKLSYQISHINNTKIHI